MTIFFDISPLRNRISVSRCEVSNPRNHPKCSIPATTPLPTPITTMAFGILLANAFQLFFSSASLASALPRTTRDSVTFNDFNDRTILTVAPPFLASGSPAIPGTRAAAPAWPPHPSRPAISSIRSPLGRMRRLASRTPAAPPPKSSSRNHRAPLFRSPAPTCTNRRAPLGPAHPPLALSHSSREQVALVVKPTTTPRRAPRSTSPDPYRETPPAGRFARSPVAPRHPPIPPPRRGSPLPCIFPVAPGSSS